LHFPFHWIHFRCQQKEIDPPWLLLPLAALHFLPWQAQRWTGAPTSMKWLGRGVGKAVLGHLCHGPHTSWQLDPSRSSWE
jgi:hypothetical protein